MVSLDDSKLHLSDEIELVKSAIPYIAEIYQLFYEYVDALVVYGVKLDLLS